MKKKPDYIFLFLLFLIVFWGIIMVFSSSSAMGIKNTGDSFFYVKRHILYVIVSSFAFYFGLNLNLTKLRKNSFLFLIGALILSGLVYLPGVGKTIGGATRWISVFGISVQPSELLKVAIVIFMAHFITITEDNLKSLFKGFIPIILLSTVLVSPILLQPDLGTTLTIMATVFIILFISGAKLIYMGYTLALSAISVFVLSFVSKYRMRRLVSFLDPWADPLGAGYQIIQSLIAVSSGGLVGLGLGNSKQKFLYLPQQYADFIFAIMCEEVGLIGAAIFMIILVAFIIRGLFIASKAFEPYLSILSSGLIIMFAVQAFLNIAVVLGLVPTTGLPLPFISYGGTAMLANMFSAGIIANISKR